MNVVLQQYAERNKPIQRESTEEDELIQGKFEGSIVTQMKNMDTMQFVMRGRRVGGQAGTFIGVPAATHIHIVGDNTHLIVRGARYNFDENNPDDRMLNAYQHLLAEGVGTPGYEECLAAFQQELGIPKDGVKLKKDDDTDDDHGDDSKRYEKWQRSGGYLRTDRFGIPINFE